MDVKTLLTLDEFMNLPDDDLQHELDEGELITMPPPSHRHSLVCRRSYDELSDAARDRDDIVVLFEAGYILSRTPDKVVVRQPDISVLRRERSAGTDEEGWVMGGPELAVEVASPSDREARIARKVQQYLASGSLAVWVLCPITREVHVYRHGEPVLKLTEDMTLTEPSLFPGWSIRAGRLLA